MNEGPLAGVRVVDLSTMISGPVATMFLGDQGADVIKVEAPGTGDLVRELGAKRAGMSATFATANRNKRSLRLNLKDARGLMVLEKLVARADVFVQNFRPGTADRMGVGEAAMRAHRPDLIYVSISGFGDTGPYAAKRVYDPVIQALSGLADVQRDRDTGRPRMVRAIIPDKVTALTAAQSITAALFARERTGRGQHVRLAMLDAVVALLWAESMAGYTWRGGPAEDGARTELAQDLVFATTDGYITAGTVSDTEWAGFLRAVDRPEWAEDPRFRTASDRVKHAAERLTLAADVLKTRSRDEWLERLDAEGVPCAPVLTRRELLEHPQVVANELILELEHPHAGPMRQARPAARFGATPAAVRRPAPRLGEHSEEILAEHDFDAQAIAALRADGII